jgi:L-alanine-DL-glutamate epimerase-like enolase superfamily enzyme
MTRVTSIEAIPLRIPFDDGGSAGALMPQKWTHLDVCLVRVATADGLVGWGEAFAYSCLTATVAAVRDMVAPLVVGREVDDIAVLNRELQQKLHIFGRYGITMFAISGLDIALWDLAAKAKGLALADLLGGAKRRTVPAYASLVRYGEPAQVAGMAAKAAAEGYRDIKLHEITLPAIEAARQAVGDGIRLTTDINCNWSAETAERLMPEMRRLGLFWVEEPLFPPDDQVRLGELARRHGVAVASGENACTSVEFARTIPHLTYPQPSVTKVGGITEFLKVVDLAAAAGKTPMPHSPYFGPGYWATLHLAAARPACGLFEFLYVTGERWIGLDMPVPQAGQVALPAGPGLGFLPDPETLGRYRLG